MEFWEILLQQVINGLSLGAMYALLALGFTMVYGIIELINFAHFNIFMVGSFIAHVGDAGHGLHGPDPYPLRPAADRRAAARALS